MTAFAIADGTVVEVNKLTTAVRDLFRKHGVLSVESGPIVLELHVGEYLYVLTASDALALANALCDGVAKGNT